jgi:hypothetical protein
MEKGLKNRSDPVKEGVGSQKRIKILSIPLNIYMFAKIFSI